MPYNIFQRQQRKLRQRWFTDEQARKIAYFQQRDKWNLWQWYRLSEQWQEYSSLTPLQREIIRKSQINNRPASHYQIYNGKIRLNPLYKKK